MATSNAVGTKITRMTASGDVLTGDIPVAAIVWDARGIGTSGAVTIADSSGIIVWVDTVVVASQHVGTFYPKTVIQNPTVASMTGGTIIIYRGSGEWNWNW